MKGRIKSDPKINSGKDLSKDIEKKNYSLKRIKERKTRKRKGRLTEYCTQSDYQ